MTSIHVRTVWATGLILCLAPVGLAGCGNAGGGASLGDSARLLSPEVVEKSEQEAASLKSNTGVDDPEKTKPGRAVAGLARKVKTASSKRIKTAQANTPPIPVRRPYRKLRGKRAKSVVARTAKTQILSELQAVVEHTPVVEKKAARIRMVPEKVIPVQVAPAKMPQDIMDALNEATKASKAEPDKAPKRIAKAQSVPEKPQFGRSQFRFSNQ